MTAATTNPVIIRDETRIVRDRHFSLDDGDDSILRALCHLRSERVIGQLVIDISHGGVCSIRFCEKQRVDFPDTP